MIEFIKGGKPMSKNYYISDLHLGDLETLEIDERPFETLQEQNREIISNWNNKVDYDDTVYLLGDFSEYDLNMTKDILTRLKGNKILLLGNHDDKIIYEKLVREGVIESINDYLEIKDNGQSIILCHYPIFSWKDKKKGSIHLYGHLHNPSDFRIKEFMSSVLMKNSYNCGCMLEPINYVPRTLEEIYKEVIL